MLRSQITSDPDINDKLEVWPAVEQFLKDWLEKERKNTKYSNDNISVSEKKTNKNWFITINPIDIGMFKNEIPKVVKKKGIENWAYAPELTKAGELHAHIMLQFNKPLKKSELKRKCSNFKITDEQWKKNKGKINVRTFDEFEKQKKYLIKEDEDNINFNKENNLQDIYTQDG